MGLRVTVLSPVTEPEFPRPTVVAVDDEPVMLRLYQRALSQAGWRVVLVGDPREALECCQRVNPQLVILDLKMPHLSGEEVLQQLRATLGRRAPPVILVSGAQDFEAVEARLGLCFGLAKPFTPPDLVASCTAAVVQYAQRLLQEGGAADQHVHDALQQAQTMLEAQAHQLSELRGALRVDSLTQVANRTGFDEKLQEVLALRRRHDQARFSLMMMDVDHFKSINDGHGHPAGDQVLRTVAATAKAALRTTDFVARYGGDEFGMILPYTPMDSAEQVARRLCAGLRAQQLPWGGDMLGITVSIGVTEAATEDTPETVVQRADTALYRVKERGRDSVQVVPGPQRGTSGS